MVNFNTYTTKSQEAIQSALSLATRSQHPNLEPEHLLTIMLTEDGIPTSILQKAGANTQQLQVQLSQALAKLPKVEGGSEPRISADLRSAFAEAENISTQMGDQYTAIDHLLLGLVASRYSWCP
jgi:ATP-dependent Clp protease ATP-binding subunit ClpB